MPATNKTAPTPRGQVAIIVKKLPLKPMTADQILKATGGTTPHNAYSLGILADRFGFRLTFGENAQGYKTYGFARPTKAAAVTSKKPAKKIAAKKTAAKKRA